MHARSALVTRPRRAHPGVLSIGESATLTLSTGCDDLRAETSHADDERFEQRGPQIANGQTTQIDVTSWPDQ